MYPLIYLYYGRRGNWLIFTFVTDNNLIIRYFVYITFSFGSQREILSNYRYIYIQIDGETNFSMEILRYNLKKIERHVIQRSFVTKLRKTFNLSRLQLPFNKYNRLVRLKF